MEKVEDQELTSLAETVCQMVACASRNRATKFGENEVYWAKFLAKSQ